jgi:hypothetical protein
MSYLLSGGLGALSAKSYVLTPTLEGDGFASLFAAYKSAYPAGTTVQAFMKDICAANGIAATVPAIEAWIFGMSGRRLPFVAKDNPGMYGGPKNVGWSHFAAGNRIKLPDVPRPGVAAPPAPPVVEAPVEVPPEQTPTSKTSPLLYAAGAGLILLALFGGKKKSDGAALKT